MERTDHNWSEYKTSEDVRMPLAQQREPCASFWTMHSMQWIQSKAIEVEVSGENSSKMNKDHVQSLLPPVAELIGRVREQTQRLSNTSRARREKEVRDAKKGRRGA